MRPETSVGLTIAGFDPSSGAGITADLAVMAAHGIFGTSCATALTVQSTLGVKASHTVPAEVIWDTLNFLAADLPPVGIKIGMLGDEAAVLVIAEFLKGRPVPVVLDPVLRSSSGRELLDPRGVVALREGLLPMVDWVTPNVEELGILSGVEIRRTSDIERAACLLRDRWPGLSIVATGGDQETADDLVVLADGGMAWLRGRRIESRATHGTGCAFSTALLCGLLKGAEPVAAAREAKAFVAMGILRAAGLGSGKGPMDLYWRFRPDGPRES
jgi:hydroxymethylpyrimidine/phosphomethylpyrimidine kinase